MKNSAWWIIAGVLSVAAACAAAKALVNRSTRNEDSPKKDAPQSPPRVNNPSAYACGEKTEEQEVAGIRTIADAIRRQDEITLGANNMPTNKAIEETERRADDASRRYYLLQEIRQLYFKDGGIQSELAALLEIAEYLPDGMRMISADKCILPLQAMVWNTVINTLIRQHNGLAAKMAKLSAVPPLVSSRPVPNAEICALLARPYTTEELPNAVSAYIERMKSAEESLERYAPLATPEKIASAEAFYQGFCKLLDSEICQNLKTFEVLEGETEVDNDGETIVISNTVGAYWNKVKLFAEAVEQFTKCWVEI